MPIWPNISYMYLYVVSIFFQTIKNSYHGRIKKTFKGNESGVAFRFVSFPSLKEGPKSRRQWFLYKNAYVRGYCNPPKRSPLRSATEVYHKYFTFCRGLFKYIEMSPAVSDNTLSLCLSFRAVQQWRFFNVSTPVATWDPRFQGHILKPSISRSYPNAE